MRIKDIPNGQYLMMGAYNCAVRRIGAIPPDDLIWCKLNETEFILVNSIRGPFDYAEYGSTSRSRRRHGNNFYPYSNVHQFLNIDDTSQWKPSHPDDRLHDFYQGMRCFISAFDLNELSIMMEQEYTVTIPCGEKKNYHEPFQMHSIVKLPSVQEIYDFQNSLTAEGKHFPIDIFMTRDGSSEDAGKIVIMNLNTGYGYRYCENCNETVRAIHPIIKLNPETDVCILDVSHEHRNNIFALDFSKRDAEKEEMIFDLLGS